MPKKNQIVLLPPEYKIKGHVMQVLHHIVLVWPHDGSGAVMVPFWKIRVTGEFLDEY